MKFQALYTTENPTAKTATLNKITELTQQDLPVGEVTIRVCYSSLNYKDALGITGKGKIFRKWPMVGGIDLAGIVHHSESSSWSEGDKVIVTGCGLGETQFGGFSQFARVAAEHVIALPEGLSLKEAMIYGTAGFTAGLCLWRLRQNNQEPNMGPFLVTGATGGVGSLAISLLSDQGFDVWAVTGRKEQAGYLKNLGAKKIVSPSELQLGERPLEGVLFGGAIDNVGGALLSGILRHVQLWGNVACVGLAGGAEFSGTVMPQILRGVSLLGISSANCPLPIRRQIWEHLARDWRSKHLKLIHKKTIGIEDIPTEAEMMISRKASGRYVIEIEPE